MQKKLTEEQQELEKSHAKQLEQLYKRRWVQLHCSYAWGAQHHVVADLPLPG